MAKLRDTLTLPTEALRKLELLTDTSQQAIKGFYKIRSSRNSTS